MTSILVRVKTREICYTEEEAMQPQRQRLKRYSHKAPEGGKEKTLYPRVSREISDLQTL